MITECEVQSACVCIGIIRGEEVDNPTLRFARSQGMRLEFISREEYKHKEDLEYPDVYVIPEGGTNQYAIEGCAEWGRKLLNIEFDQVYLAVGTGGTARGLIQGLDGKRELTGVPVLKNYDFDFKILKEYHHGGYAKVTDELKKFCNSFHIRVEPTYTGKVFFAVIDQIKKEMIKRGTTVLVIHTGGLQTLSK